MCQAYVGPQLPHCFTAPFTRLLTNNLAVLGASPHSLLICFASQSVQRVQPTQRMASHIELSSGMRLGMHERESESELECE